MSGLVDPRRTLEIVRSYHDAWSTRRFDDAVGLLSESLEVEVPVNDYPTRASFAQALTLFGGMVEGVRLLSALAEGEEAMLLYDMRVASIGSLRIAEHFIVEGELIVRIRQVHDTLAIRAAGLGS